VCEHKFDQGDMRSYDGFMWGHSVQQKGKEMRKEKGRGGLLGEK
jgi:hypothetical protein